MHYSNTSTTAALETNGEIAILACRSNRNTGVFFFFFHSTRSEMSLSVHKTELVALYGEKKRKRKRKKKTNLLYRIYFG